jgi:hypothetical protein
MNDVHAFCVRILGDGEAASAAEQAALVAVGDRVESLIAAAAACRASGDLVGAGAAGLDRSVEVEPSLARTVARELRRATARLPERQREALALRELLELSYEDLARVVGVEPTAVAPLLARARLRLRAELRGQEERPSDCPEREQALRTMALRLDGRPVVVAEDDWLMEHLGHCGSCGRAHAAMLEASACYRAWQ